MDGLHIPEGLDRDILSLADEFRDDDTLTKAEINSIFKTQDPPSLWETFITHALEALKSNTKTPLI